MPRSSVNSLRTFMCHLETGRRRKSKEAHGQDNRRSILQHSAVTFTTPRLSNPRPKRLLTPGAKPP